MVHCSIRQYKKNSKLHPVINIETLEFEQVQNEEIIAQLGKKELLRMIQALSPSYRMVFNLFVFEGCKHREIAKLLEISEGTSKSNLFEAKVILRKAVINSLKIAIQRI